MDGIGPKGRVRAATAAAAPHNRHSHHCQKLTGCQHCLDAQGVSAKLEHGLHKAQVGFALEVAAVRHRQLGDVAAEGEQRVVQGGEQGRWVARLQRSSGQLLRCKLLSAQE